MYALISLTLTTPIMPTYIILMKYRYIQCSRYSYDHNFMYFATQKTDGKFYNVMACESFENVTLSAL